MVPILNFDLSVLLGPSISENTALGPAPFDSDLELRSHACLVAGLEHLSEHFRGSIDDYGFFLEDTQESRIVCL